MTFSTKEQAEILIIDDKVDNLNLLASMLSQENYRVRCSASGAFALEVMERFKPDLILLDITMPDMNGYEVCQKLKANEDTADIPVIFISALNDSLDKVQAFSVGGVDYVTKPFEVSEVLARVKNHLSLCHAKAEIISLNQDLEHRVELRTAELQASQAKLRENEKYLEQRVKDRTAELTGTLQVLQETQAQLIRTEKLSSLGKLAGGMAHEFNNPLTFIRGNLDHIRDYIDDLIALGQLCEQKTDTMPELKQYLAEIDLEYMQQDIPKVLFSMESGANRIEQLVDTLQQFVGVDEVGVKPQDLNQCLEETLQFLNTQIPHSLEIVKSYQPLPLVNTYPGELGQVFLAILSNAIDATRTSQDDTTQQITISTLALSEDWVSVSISDTGPGIPADIQDKIFDPFFTTKPVGQGTGMGLALCIQTVQAHNGKLSVNSTVGQGATFVVELPVKGPENGHSDQSTDESGAMTIPSLDAEKLTLRRDAAAPSMC